MPSLSQSMVALSSATMTGSSAGKTRMFGPICMPAASGARRASSGTVWNIWTGAVMKCWAAQTEAKPFARATRTCSTRLPTWGPSGVAGVNCVAR